MIKKIDGCANNPEKSSKKKKKKGDHVPSGYLLCTKWAFDPIENKHILYRGEDRMKKFCSSLRKHTANVVNFKKKKMLPLKTHQDATACYIYGKSLLKMKIIKELETIAILLVNTEIQHIVYVI